MTEFERAEITLGCDDLDCPGMKTCDPQVSYPSDTVLFCLPPETFDSFEFLCGCTDYCLDCSFDNWDACHYEDCCNEAGRWWYQGFGDTYYSCHKCHESCLSGQIIYCTTSDCCVDAGFFWYDTICNECSSTCVGGDLSTCHTYECCINHNGTWNNNGCYDCGDNCDETNFSGCPERECCEAYAWYWYDNACHDVPFGCYWNDDFSVDLSKWTDIFRYTIVNGQLVSIPDDDCSAVLNTVVSGDVDIQIDIEFESGKSYVSAYIRLGDTAWPYYGAQINLSHQGITFVAPSYQQVGCAATTFPDPTVLRIKRVGTSITGYYSTDGGSNWTSLGTYTGSTVPNYTQFKIGNWSYVYDATLDATTYWDNLTFNGGCPPEP